MNMKSVAFKTSDYLKTQKDIVAYLNAALEDGDTAVLLEALRNVAQAKE
jgi:DNA-binding phage protein